MHLQIDNKEALSYLLKVGGIKNGLMTKFSKPLSSKSQYVYHSRMPAFSTENSSIQVIKGKSRLFRVASSSQCFSSGFLTTRFSDNRSICFPPMPSITSIYSLASRSLRTDAMIQNLNMGLPFAFPPFSMISRVFLKTKQECVPLLILVWSTQPWYPELLDLCVKEPVLLLQGIEILISQKSIAQPLTVENSLTLAACLVSGKPFHVKKFQKTPLTLSQIPDEKAHSLIMSENYNLDPFQAPVKDIREYLTFLFNSSVIRQKGASQNGCFKKAKRAKIPEKQTFLTP